MKDEKQKLRKFIDRNRALADVPFSIVHGRSITPRESLAMLQRDEAVPEVAAAMSMAGPIPLQQEWQLVEDYYKMLLSRPGPHPKICWIGGEMTFEEALTHVRAKDAEGRRLLSMYQGLKREMVRRMK